MTFDTYTIVYLITNFFSIAVNHRFMMAFFEQRRSKTWVCALSYFAYFAVTSCLYLFLDIPIVTLLANYGLFFLISLNYVADTRKRILSSLYILAFCVIAETIIAACSGYFKFSIFHTGAYSNILGAIAVPLLTYMVALLLYNFKSVRRNPGMRGSIWMNSVLIPIITFVLHAFVVHAEDVSKTEVILSTVLILLINVITFYLYDSLAASYMKLAETKVLEKEKELYYNQCNLMQNTTNELRTFRHDIKNQLICVSEFMASGNYEAAKQLVGELSGRMEAKLLFSTTGNVPVDSIINYKLQNAVDEKIQVETEIAVPPELGVDISDCITVLGNLLDNALYALRRVGEAERFLRFKVVFDKGRLLIRCVNPYVTEVQYENGKIISAKEDREEHGFGLKNIEAVAEKYHGCMEINHENQCFDVSVLLFLTFDDNK